MGIVTDLAKCVSTMGIVRALGTVTSRAGVLKLGNEPDLARILLRIRHGLRWPYGKQLYGVKDHGNRAFHGQLTSVALLYAV